MINLPKFKIGDLEINLIQGGMGVGISGSNLASAVANEGGAGIIASVGLGEVKRVLNKLEDKSGNYAERNAKTLIKEIEDARKMSNGVIGVNIMYALSDYPELVQASVEKNVDLIITGAGPAKDLPTYLDGKDIKLVSIVSSLRAAKFMHRAWEKKGHAPDAFIVEGPMAGGHLGFKYEDLINNTAPKLEDIAKEVIEFANNLETPIPTVVAGGVYTGQNMKEALEYGAAGVQMGTRFVTTKECDADNKFKLKYLNATKEDIKIIKSPVGMPGRAIINPFLRKVNKGEKIDFNCGYHCLKTCKPKESPYCIAEALVDAQEGKFDRGFVFAGANAYMATPDTCLDENGEFITVKTLMQRLSDEYHAAL